MDASEAVATNIALSAVLGTAWPDGVVVGDDAQRAARFLAQRAQRALGDGLDDCELVSAGRHGAQSLWLYSNGADTFVTIPDVTDVWEVRPCVSRVGMT